MKFHQKLTWLMKRARLSQQSIADSLSVSQGLVSFWCRGKNEPILSDAVLLADLLDVPLDLLCDERFGISHLEELRWHREVRAVVEEIGAERAWRRLVHGARDEGESPTPGRPPPAGPLLTAPVLREIDLTPRLASKPDAKGDRKEPKGDRAPTRRR